VPDAGPTPSARRRWLTLGLLAVAVLAAMSPWFTASAAGDFLREQHGLSSGEVAWLTGSVQLGFVVGTLLAALLNVADLVPSRRLFTVCALLSAGANAVLVLAPSYPSLLVFRFLTGFFLAGVYPPSMKMAATWFLTGRGVAIGTIVGALTVGKAAPFLLRGGGGGGAAGIILGASALALAGGALVFLLYRDGPHAFPRRPFKWSLVGDVLRDRPTRLATWGYLGHMWELYAMWSAIGLFFTAHFVVRGVADPGGAAAIVAFWVISAGGVGSIAAGVLADRFGRERIASGALALSGLVALVIGWGLGGPTWLLVAVALVWGTAVVADSAQFSALVTEVAPPHAAGTALTLQTSLGFLLTIVTIQGVPWVAEHWGWGPAFALLVPGPVVGMIAMARLRRLREEGARARAGRVG